MSELYVEAKWRKSAEENVQFEEGHDFSDFKQFIVF